MEARVRAQRQAHHLVGTRRNTARGDHQVSVGCLVEGAAQLLRRITRAQVSDNPPACVLHQAAQQDAVRVGDLAAFQGLARAPEFRSRRHHEDAGARQDREGPVAHRNRGRQRSPIQEAARLEDQGTCLEGLTLDAHVRAQLRGDANLHGSGGLSNPGRVVRVLNLDDRVRALGEGSARHDTHRLTGLEAVLARIARRDVSHDRQ